MKDHHHFWEAGFVHYLIIGVFALTWHMMGEGESRLEARIEQLEGEALSGDSSTEGHPASEGAGRVAPSSFSDSLLRELGEPEEIESRKGEDVYWYSSGDGFVIRNDRMVGVERRGE